MRFFGFLCRKPKSQSGKAPRYLLKFPEIYGNFFPIAVLLGVFSATSVCAQTTPNAAPPPQAQASPAKVDTTAPLPISPAAQAPALQQANETPTSSAKSATSQSAPHDTQQTAPEDIVSSLIPHDLSPYGMFMNADIVVKIVMVGLAFASLVTWTILLVKALELGAARSRANKALAGLAAAHTLSEAVSRLDGSNAPVSRLAAAALAETDRSRGLPTEGIKERATALLSRIEARAGRTMGRGTGLLATIGSTAPFVGLFGTVWGIMNSFIGISKTNTTNLAVVAPGIAEALLATAFGLVAAIPAVIIYNVFARAITGYRSVLNDASTEVLRLLSRDLDREADANGVIPSMSRRAAE